MNMKMLRIAGAMGIMAMMVACERREETPVAPPIEATPTPADTVVPAGTPSAETEAY